MTELPTLPKWAKSIFQSLDLNRDSSVHDILDNTDSLATKLAPNTRRLWNFILFFQGTAVLAPLFWLIVVRERWEVSITAYLVVFCTIMVVAICWWVRYRGMQYSWARARLVAEIARSQSITQKVAPHATTLSLSGVPSLKPIAEWIATGSDHPDTSLEERKSRYVKKRIEDQLEYYQRKRKESIRERRRLSKIVTVSLDAGLFLAVAGWALSLRSEATRWLDWSSSDYVLGFLGAALPLIAILAQLRGAYLELNRRVGRFAQQIEFLESAREEIPAESDEQTFLTQVSEAERTLLSEVVEWFYQTEHTEPYYRSKKTGERVDADAVSTAHSDQRIGRITGGLATAASFLGRVLFGRVLVVAVSVVLTTALIQYRKAPDDPNIQSVLRQEDGLLLSPVAGEPYTLWHPHPKQTQNGFILIAHGLRDAVDIETTKEHWMTRLEIALRNTLGPDHPDICLVDWHGAANPSNVPGATLDSRPLEALGMPRAATDMMNELAMIRPQGERIGELVGFKLARAIRNGKLSTEQPFHFIGHSAGGFVILHAAMVLVDLGLAPNSIQITFLDTPWPVKEDLELIAAQYPIDYYVTSVLAQGVPSHKFTNKFLRFRIPLPEGIDAYAEAHSFAHDYYIDSIKNPEAGIAFGLSPFAPQGE